MLLPTVRYSLNNGLRKIRVVQITMLHLNDLLLQLIEVKVI